ncbi:hypothetical protein INT48_005585 [Thamnidium elegans]|uniref:Carboxymuconolactone decarboxylase-like domain-containing protein n=1 Tax=Thamnidium elegans TaxID=101142 RepID=A0A8H7W3U0_9FUNG|nr:hypothetical protein INT48_005585 [Thamnidium elegans]
MDTANNQTYIELTKLIATEDMHSSLAAMLLVTLSACNHPHGVPIVVNKYLQQIETVEDQVKWIEYTRNAIVKSSVLSGIPRAINSQTALYNSLPELHRSLLRKSPTLNQTENYWKSRGSKLLQAVYGEEFDNAGYILNNASSDLWNLIEQAYGNVFAETTYLGYIETELDVIVTLVQMNTLPQLKNHLKGAIRVGATEKQVKAALVIGHTVRDTFLNKSRL